MIKYVFVIGSLNPNMNINHKFPYNKNYNTKKCPELLPNRIYIRAEFLKAATMQSHYYAKYLRICANFGLINAK